MRIGDWSSDVCYSGLRYAGTIADGIAGGSVRAIDPLIAAQTLMALQNAAFDMRKWASTMPRDRAVSLYASTPPFGLSPAWRRGGIAAARMCTYWWSPVKLKPQTIVSSLQLTFP